MGCTHLLAVHCACEQRARQRTDSATSNESAHFAAAICDAALAAVLATSIADAKPAIS